MWQKRKVGQDAPPGGLQPKEKGINKTARALGLTKEEVRRSAAIAAISPKVRTRIRELNLDNHQKLLLELAKQSGAITQLQSIEKFLERKRADAGSEQNAATEIADLEDELQKLDERRAKRQGRLRVLQDKIASHIATAAEAEDDGDQGGSTARANNADEAAGRAGVDAEFERLKARWQKFVQADWEQTPERSRTRFVVEVLGYPDRAIRKEEERPERRAHRRW